MNRTIQQNTCDLDVAVIRMNQARDKLVDAIIAGDAVSELRLDKVFEAAFADYKDLQAERRFMDRNTAYIPPPNPKSTKSCVKL